MEPIEDPPQPRASPLRWLFLSIGTLSLGIGALGTVVPGLPTTPFVLLAAACYVRSSERLYRWLITNRVFGPVLETWRTQRGMTLRAKLVTLALVWLMLGSAALFLAESLFMKLVLIGIASVKTVVLARIRTVAAEG
ncbi:MAG: YbaN family protein [Oscillochloridaceae bacterium]|nr:YbaN family protein [Chloroflexaceae bacterium]MCX7791290.1 YbaN family protein [Chloroflexaceae bacterium]MDW8389698.1 YbaN family protein [Oscillochloridaceae bacterium]